MASEEAKDPWATLAGLKARIRIAGMDGEATFDAGGCHVTFTLPWIAEPMTGPGRSSEEIARENQTIEEAAQQSKGYRKRTPQ